MTDESLFAAALELPASDRAAYLNAHCPDPAVRRQVEELLAAADASNPLDRRPVDVEQTVHRTQQPPEPSASVGDRVGPYKLLEKIGEGGMGEVWVANQLEPIKRRVAVKLIKPGMDSRSVLGRFEAERQALAVMDHPNIAKVLDAGTTPDGRPYFVMELVKGTPITEFADARKLTPKQRLELFVPVCQAIQHAHMKGIIHRDIKPSNVLVALHDETPVPKVIDFGVAKAVGQQLTEKTIYTGFGALVGTPTYMAPEQATFNQLDVDTRADVYALGVLLYELLAGSPPIERERLKKAALDEVLRMVREEEPPRPSQRLSTADTRASIAATRGSEPAKLSQLMKGELDWIVMKALEKDRARRYETANGFAADVQRYLSGEQVQAVPPSLGYRLAKAYRRNKAAVWVACAFSLMLLTGVAVATVLAIQARRAEAIAREKEQEAQEQREEAEQNKDAWLKVSEVYWEAAVEAEIRSAGARIDADLLEYKADARVGLLRLARPLKNSVTTPSIGPNFSGTTFTTFEENPDFVKLREFQTAAVISSGQEFVPLVLPFELPYEMSWPGEVSSDSRRCIAGYECQGLELLAIPNLARIGVLREGTERVLQYGFSPDGQTIFTQDPDSVVRFWNTDGTLRARTPLRPERFIYPAGMGRSEVRLVAKKANPLLVANGIALLQSEQVIGVRAGYEPNKVGSGRNGPNDLYDTRTGKFLRRLDKPGRKLSEWKLSPDKRWLVYKEESVDKKDVPQVVIVSAADGRELARLDHPGPEPFLTVEVSPTGKWVVTHRHTGGSYQSPPGPRNVVLWTSSGWKQVKDAALIEAISAIKGFQYMSFVTDDLLSLSSDGGMDAIFQGVVRIGKPGSWTPERSFAFHAPDWENPVGELGGTLLRQGRALLTADPIQRLKPPRGRKYHPDLAKLAPDGRFWENIDTVTEKDLPCWPGGQHFPGFGRVTVRAYHDEFDGVRGNDHTELRILPDAKRLDFPSELVELWAQVVVGGELSPEGTFQPWDQPTWAAKQRELAAAKPPYADFPFPGWAATEPNLWYRIRANGMKAGRERDKLLEAWQRTQPPPPDPGPDKWRTPEIIPPPRESK